MTSRRSHRSVSSTSRAIAGAVVSLGIVLSASPSIALAEEDEISVTAEDSILVATHQSKDKTSAPNAQNSDDDSLEPVSQYSEHSPDIADDADAETDTEKPAKDRFSAALAGATEAPQIDAQPAKFNGIQPGKSTEKDVRKAWNEPKRTTTTSDGAVLTYAIEPFRAVEVQIANEEVTAINIEL